MKVTKVQFRRGDVTSVVYPYEAVTDGVYLAEGQVDGIYDAPIKTTWKTGSFQVGSTQKAVKHLHRDMTLGFHVIDTASTYEFNESTFRRLFHYEVDLWDPTATTVLDIETDLSGTRSIGVLMYEQPEFEAARDPIQDQYGNLLMKLRAGQPHWFEDDVVSTVANGYVAVENPTDQVMRHEWLLAPGVYAIPDVSWSGAPGAREPGGSFSDRSIAVTVTSEDGVARISLDRQKLMVRNSADTNILARLGGQIFAFPVPPYTPAQTLPVSATGACALHQPRRWSRPWGLELEGGS